METLYETLKKLNVPEDIELAIMMFNPDHRPDMNLVFEEMYTEYFPEKTAEYWKRKYHSIVHTISYLVWCEDCDQTKPVSMLESRYCHSCTIDNYNREVEDYNRDIIDYSDDGGNESDYI